MPKKLVTRQEVLEGDCVKLLDGMKAGRAMLAIADPPYNQGAAYDAYEDNKSYDEYMAWTRRWLGSLVRVVHKYGSIWVFAPDEWVSEIDMVCRHELKLFKRRHVIWAFTFGQKAQQNFTRSHVHLLYFLKTRSKYTFNEDALRVPSARQAVYKDKRAETKGKPPDDVWMLHRSQLEPHMTPDRDTWLESRICGTYKEREKHAPNQIPEAIMGRIVLACSDPGDLVVDPFAGTGSSGVACARHNRNYLGFDISPTCVRESRRRIAQGLKAAG